MDGDGTGGPDGYAQPTGVGQQLLNRRRLEAIRGLVDEVRQVRPHGVVPRQQPFLDELADDDGGERLADRAEDERRVGRDRAAILVGDPITGQMLDSPPRTTATAVPGTPLAAMRSWTQASIRTDSSVRTVGTSSDAAATALLGSSSAATRMVVAKMV